MKHSELVRQFHEKFDLVRNDQPTLDIDEDLVRLRLEILLEEVEELITAVEDDDFIGIADALADIKYVVEGTAITYGIPLDDVFEEVHRSNMTKEKRDYPAGASKIKKGEDYEPPQIGKLLT